MKTVMVSAETNCIGSDFFSSFNNVLFVKIDFAGLQVVNKQKDAASGDAFGNQSNKKQERNEF